MASSAIPRKGERFEVRLSTEAKQRLARAAALRGSSVSEFVLSTALAAADQAIRDYRILELSDRDFAAFRAAVERPPEVNDNLRRAFQQHAQTVRVSW